MEKSEYSGMYQIPISAKTLQLGPEIQERDCNWVQKFKKGTAMRSRNSEKTLQGN